MQFPGLKVLVVEDDQSVRKLLYEMLRYWGCDVKVACNGREGVQKYRIFCPNLVFMDLEMPLLNGVEASREIMELDPQTSILLVTGSPDSHLAQEALEKRLVRAVIPKPFELHQLKVAIENAVKKARPPSIQKIKARLSFVIFAISAKIEHNLEFTGNEIRGLKECLSQIRDDFLKVD